MKKLKVAILEDNKTLLKDLKRYAEETNLIEVVAWAISSEDFLKKCDEMSPEALFLDINLRGDDMNGLDIAYRLKLPVLFVSGNNHKHIKELEKLKRTYDIPVGHFTKPIIEEDFRKTVEMFVREIRMMQPKEFIYLDFKHSKHNKIPINSIAYIESDIGESGRSNNKNIYFNNRKPEKLIDFSFTQREKFGLNPKIFITTHKSFVVNSSNIKCYADNHTVELECQDSSGKSISQQVPVSENYRKATRKILT